MSGGTVRLTVPPESEGERLDRFLAERIPSQTRSALRRLILEGRVAVDGRTAAKAGVELSRGMHVEVDVPAPPSDAVLPESGIAVPVLHEDEHLLVVDKPAGLVVHPGHGHPSGTLVNAVLGMGIGLAPAGGARRPGIVHRLDRDTSGVLVLSRTDEAHRALVRAFASRHVRKVYEAIVWGHPDPPSGTVARPIGRSRSDPTRMSVRSPRGREAVTDYRTIETLPGFSRLEIGLRTGRTHQIRVHLLSIHHPIVGDERYGGQPWRGVQDPVARKALREFGRLALHARRLVFEHPVTGEIVDVASEPPGDYAALLSILRRRR